ncbi:F-box protein SKIP23-like [Tasmannia lanceolata]|uniref:F-box protein SKIP23-like n=1 Tax=Tasmannia lanceolata TaxID=3420 RepID=UPI004062D39F
MSSAFSQTSYNGSADQYMYWMVSFASNPIDSKKVHMSSEMGKWSEVPNELLAMVLDRLPLFIDCIRFGAVCSSWYEVTKENRHWLDFQGQLPLMMVPDNERTETRILKTALSTNPISTQDYIVVAIVTNMWKLSFYKPGDEKWTTINHEWVHYYDVTFFKDKLYGITNSKSVVTCDFASNDFPKFSVITHTQENDGADQRYLVESSRRLLKVLRFMDWDPIDNENLGWPNRTEGFEDFELDEERGKWIEINSLGDHILFLGFSSSFSLSAREFPRCKGNCILLHRRLWRSTKAW